MRPGGRTRPLRCFAIRGLSSDSRALRDVEVIRSSISSLVSMALLAWVHDFVLLGLHNIFCRMTGVLAESRIWCKKAPLFTPFICIRYQGSKEPVARVPIERHGRPRPCERYSKGPSSAGEDERQRTFRRHTCHGRRY